jgi:hypothetical protein
MATLNSILADVAAVVDQDTALATGTELTVRVNLVNQALNEWAEAYEWKQLRQQGSLAFALSGASVALPTNYKRLMSPVYDAGNVYQEYKEIDPDTRFLMGQQDKYVWTGGNDASGKFINFNPGMASGMSLVYEYQSTPSSLATLADISVCPSGEYLAKRTIAYILQSRSDGRFPVVKAESDDLLSNMIEDESGFSGAQINTTPDFYAKRGWRIGEE